MQLHDENQQCGEEVYCPQCMAKRNKIIEYDGEVFTAQDIKIATDFLEGKITDTDAKSLVWYKKIRVTYARKRLLRIIQAMYQTNVLK